VARDDTATSAARSALVLAPHPDDETLGCGATILRKRAAGTPVHVLIVTDGEPTAHLMRDGRAWFDWPPAPETIELTLAEVDKMTRRHAALNIFMLADDDRLAAFVDNVAKRNGGRVLRATPERLGEYVVSDFLRTRGARRQR